MNSCVSIKLYKSRLQVRFGLMAIICWFLLQLSNSNLLYLKPYYFHAVFPLLTIFTLILHAYIMTLFVSLVVLVGIKMSIDYPSCDIKKLINSQIKNYVFNKHEHMLSLTRSETDTQFKRWYIFIFIFLSSCQKWKIITQLYV